MPLGVDVGLSQSSSATAATGSGKSFSVVGGGSGGLATGKFGWVLYVVLGLVAVAGLAFFLRKGGR